MTTHGTDHERGRRRSGAPQPVDDLLALIRRARRTQFTDDLDEIVAELDAAMEHASLADRGSLLLSRAIARQTMPDPAVPATDAVEAFELLRNTDRSTEACLAAAVAAVMSHRAGRIRVSIELAVEALVLSESNADSADLVRALNSLAVMFSQKGAFETADALSVRAIEGDSELARLPAASFTAAYITIDGIHQGCDLDLSVARTAIGRLESAEDSNDVGRLVIAPAYRAEVALVENDLDALEAFALTDEVIQLAAPRLRGWVWLVVGAVAERLGRYDEAVRHLDRAVPLLQSTSDHYRLLRALKARRDAHAALGDAELALDDANRSLELLETVRQEQAKALGDQISERAKVEAARLALVRRANELPESETVDSLSRLGSRSWLELALDELADVGGRVTVVTFDVDHFDLVNQRLGRAAGDHVIQRVGRILADTFRSEDLVARYDGDRFVAVLPRTSSTMGRSFANRVREALAAEPWGEVGPRLWVRVSVGISTGRMDRIRDVVADSMGALHVAKRSGRNRVVAA